MSTHDTTTAAVSPDDLRMLQHELRVPLNAVLGFSQLIKATQRAHLPERVLHWIEQIEFAGQHMLHVIEALGAAAERRHDAAAHEPMPTSDLLRAVQGSIRMMRLAAVHAGAQVSLCAEVGRPILVVGSETTHRQVLINLLSNAIKYSPRGERVSIEIAGQRSGHAQVVIRDRGIGMSAEQLARLFTPYERLGREASGASGNGLGLYLTKQLVESVGGTLAVESQPGGGTTVTVSVPMAVKWEAAAA